MGVENLPAAGGLLTSDLKQLHEDTIKQLMADGGTKIKLFFDPTSTECPNCFIAPDGRSNGVYTGGSNPNPLGQFNKPFPKGSACPVCGGSHKILSSSTAEYTALIRWNPQDLGVLPEGFQPANVARTLTLIVAFEDAKRAKKALIEGNVCVRLRDPVPAGFGSNKPFARTFWIKQQN